MFLRYSHDGQCDDENTQNDYEISSGTASSHLLVTGHKNGHIRFWDTDTGRIVTTLSSHKSQINAMAFSPQNQNNNYSTTLLRLVSVANDLSLKVI